MTFDRYAFGYRVSVWGLPVWIAVTCEKVGHGWTVWRVGDVSVKRLGCAVFSFLEHANLVGAVILCAAYYRH
mgnify:CR=1 FL=1